MSITIILADDHPMFRSGVRHELEESIDFEILAETGDGEEALNLIKTMKADVAVLDIQMPKLTGLDIARNIQHSEIKTKIVLLTMFDDQKFFSSAIETGVLGYVLKNDAIQDIVEAVRSVAHGSHYISPSMAGLFINNAGTGKDADKTKSLIYSLSGTEKKILSLIAELKMNEEIANLLFISKRTVENNKTIIAQKLGLSSAKQLLKFAAEHKDLLNQKGKDV